MSRALPCAAALLAACAATEERASERVIEVQYLFLDDTTCGRCVDTERNLDAAVAALAPELAAGGVRVEVEKVLVETAEQAERVRLVSSPTILIDGRDAAVELGESACTDCGELCGSAADVACRTWAWEGEELSAAPAALIVQALREAAAAPPAEPAPQLDFELPDNLRRFFAAKAAGAMPAASSTEPCCDRGACCAPGELAAGCCAAPAAGPCCAADR